MKKGNLFPEWKTLLNIWNHWYVEDQYRLGCSFLLTLLQGIGEIEKTVIGLKNAQQ